MIKKFIIISLCSMISFAGFGQLATANGDIVPPPKYNITAHDGLYAIDSLNLGILDSSLMMRKIRWKLGSNLTYSNGVLNAVLPSTTSSPAAVTDYLNARISVTGTGKKLTFTNLPADYKDYFLVKNGIKILVPLEEYTASGNVVTILIKCYTGDKIQYRRLR